MYAGLAGEWSKAFMGTIREREISEQLKEAALARKLAEWTTFLTSAVVESCVHLGLQASAKGHKKQMLPVCNSEYLGLDVIAFEANENRWMYPKAVFELENQMKYDRIAYTLWKVLCVRSDLKVLFCYCQSSDEASSLISFLGSDVINSMELENRTTLEGETIIAVGNLERSFAFPHDFFKWWSLNKNTGIFEMM